MTRPTPGLRVRHSRACRTTRNGSCDCEPTIEAWVYSARDEVKIRKSFSGKGAAKDAARWRADALSALGRGKLRPPTRRTIAEEAADWHARAESGEAVTRSGRPFKPGVIRGVESDFRLHISPDLGPRRLSEIRRQDVQALVDRLRASGLSGSKVRGIVTSLKIVLRRPLEDDELTVNPTERLRLPPPAGTRDRAATVDEVEQLIAALPIDLRPLYATAAYAGLRRGELRGLQVGRRQPRKRNAEGRVAPGTIGKGRSSRSLRPGTREVPIPPPLRDYLAELKARTGRDGDEFVFGNVPGPSVHADECLEAGEEGVGGRQQGRGRARRRRRTGSRCCSSRSACTSSVTSGSASSTTRTSRSSRSPRSQGTVRRG